MTTDTHDSAAFAPGEVRTVHNGRSALALHTLRGPDSDDDRPAARRPLLYLHGLGERTPESTPAEARGWPGPVVGLDLTGHGASTTAPGGGYTAEILMADVDAAVAELGTVTILGRGLGAYIALLIAGGRPAAVKGAVLADGPGLVGGGIRPGTPSIPMVAPSVSSTPDPMVLLEMARDVRPRDYAVDFVRLANEGSGMSHPIAVCTVVRPEWLQSVVDQPGVLVTSVPEALERYAQLA